MDSPRDRIVMFGGFDGTTYHNDLWTYNLTTKDWLQLPTTGPLPDPRRGHTIVFDKTYFRWLLFGGFDGTSYFNDVWALDLSGAPTWTRLEPGGPVPPPRSGHVAMWDPFHGKMIVHGGFDGSYLGDTWVLEFPTNTGVPPRVSRVELHPAYPNPFNPTTMIGFELPSAATVRLRVVDAGGRLVRELINERRPEGPGLVTWDGLTGSGVRASSGVYSCILEVGSERRAQSIVLVK
jgi:hypothetical protein